MKEYLEDCHLRTFVSQMLWEKICLTTGTSGRSVCLSVIHYLHTSTLRKPEIAEIPHITEALMACEISGCILYQNLKNQEKTSFFLRTPIFWFVFRFPKVRWVHYRLWFYPFFLILVVRFCIVLQFWLEIAMCEKFT